MSTSTQKTPFQPGYYRHTKSGKLYRAHLVASHSESLEPHVVYEALYDTQQRYWIRPLDMFMESIELEGKLAPRYTYLGDTLPRM